GCKRARPRGRRAACGPSARLRRRGSAWPASPAGVVRQRSSLSPGLAIGFATRRTSHRQGEVEASPRYARRLSAPVAKSPNDWIYVVFTLLSGRTRVFG